MKTLTISALLIISLSAVAQQIGEAWHLTRALEHVTEKKGGDLFKGQLLKGKWNGMGFVTYKNGDAYAGDFRQGKRHGYGMLLSSNGIKYCEGAIAYVGIWSDDKKTGKGTCYDKRGKVIYNGSFENDKPTEEYPSSAPDTLMCFVIANLNDGNTYIGEIGSKGLPNGLGYIAFENGDLWQSSFDNGNRKAIGLHLAYDGEWQTVNCKGKDATVVSTSEYYAKIDEKRRKQWNLFWYGDENGNFWTAMSDIANELDNFSHSLLGDGNNSASYNAPDGSSLLDSPSNSNGGNYQLQYDNWARRAESHYNSLTNLGWSATSKTGRKSGGTGQGMNGGNYVSMKQSLREAQREMQKIRQRAAKAGVIITPAKWETATVRY